MCTFLCEEICLHFKSLSVCASKINVYVFFCVKVCMFMCVFVSELNRRIALERKRDYRYKENGEEYEAQKQRKREGRNLKGKEGGGKVS